MKNHLRLTRERFYTSIAKLRLSDSTIQIAKRALVDGEDLSVLAKDYDLTLQRVSKIVIDVYEATSENKAMTILTEQILILLKRSEIPARQKTKLRKAMVRIGFIEPPPAI